ncbi:hypothetical protein HYPSUDRAFT_63834 [Hypholoma sublateritium FD-334 SS-4]|uniref:F-box domain-containing protein n=1 Tax=Hypholoma sublateritium (strain FD-334 SS-4) TaxID=945553 RepID=A0A0D2PDE6_HYPSF|nr:hypothetical protein HYPSUDRAFT_63834 [Hypholoma sublateritium FD-334 SS-4]
MQSRRSNVPTELIDDIIDKLATSDPHSKPALSNVASVSRGFRRRVNHHRFSILEICIHTTPSDRLENLAKILCWDLWEQQEGIAQHIRSVRLILGRRDSGVPTHSESRDKIIAHVVKAVFKGSGNESSNQTPRSLTICTTDYYRYPNNGPYHIAGLSFDTLGNETIAALHDPRCSQYVTTLRLERMWNIPTSLVSAPAIKNLHINHAHFTASEISGNGPPLPSLVYLEVKEAPSFVPACYHGRGDEHMEPIARAKYWLRKPEEYGGLTRIGTAATMLEVIVDEYLDVPFATVYYIQSNALQCLRIQRKYDQWSHAESTKTPTLGQPFQPFFLGMLHLLPSVPPPEIDLKIQVSLKYYYLPTAIFDSLDYVYSRIYHFSLVEWLEKMCSSTGTQANITLVIEFDLFEIRTNDYDPVIFQEIYEPYMHKLLAPLGRIKGVKLNIKIYAF